MRTTTIGRRAGVFAVGLAFGVAALGAGCSSSDDSSDATTTTTTPSEAVCADWAKVKTSVTDLKDVSLTADGTDGVQSAVDDLKTSLKDLESSVKADVKPEAEALTTAVDGLETSIKSLGSGSPGEGLSAVGDSIQAVAKAAGELGTALEVDCPS